MERYTICINQSLVWYICHSTFDSFLNGLKDLASRDRWTRKVCLHLYHTSIIVNLDLLSAMTKDKKWNILNDTFFCKLRMILDSSYKLQFSFLAKKHKNLSGLTKGVAKLGGIFLLAGKSYHIWCVINTFRWYQKVLLWTKIENWQMQHS